MAGVDPLYKHVKEQIVASLSGGEWKPGEMLPSEASLAARFKVGVSTIRAALAALARAGIVVRRQGKGTFVGVHGEQHSVYRFFHLVRDGGGKDLPVSELLDFRKGVADDQDAERLRLPRDKAGRAVFRIRNLLRVHSTPVVVSDVVIPAAAFPRLTAKQLREGGRTLYSVYQRRFGITIARAVEEIRAEKADAVARKLFAMSTGTPVLEVRRVAYTFGNRPVEVRRSQVDTRNYHYSIDQGDEL